MSTLKATYLQQASSASPNITLDASTNATVAGTLAMGSSFKRNAIINGNMSVAQRGSGVAVTGSTTYYALDRFFAVVNGGTTGAGSKMYQSTSAPSNFQYSLKFGRESGGTSTNQPTIGQVIESINCYPFQGQTATLSFYAKAGANYSASGNAFTYSIDTGTGTDQGSANIFGSWTGQVSTSANVTLTTSWQRFTVTVSIGASVTELGLRFWYTPTGTAGADDYFYITGVQLEVGSVATPYERQIYSDQLAQCQRYCFKGTLYDLGRATDATYPSNLLLLPVTMRSTPSFTAANGSYTVNSGSSGTPALLFNSPNTVFLYNSANNWTATAFVQFNGFVTAEL